MDNITSIASKNIEQRTICPITKRVRGGLTGQLWHILPFVTSGGLENIVDIGNKVKREIQREDTS